MLRSSFWRFRRWKYPELIVDSDSEDDDEIDEKMAKTFLAMADTKSKATVMSDIKRRASKGAGGVDRGHLANHMHMLNEVKGGNPKKGKKKNK